MKANVTAAHRILVVCALQVASAGVACVLMPTLQSMASDIRWIVFSFPMAYSFSASRQLSFYWLLVFLFLLIVGHPLPLALMWLRRRKRCCVRIQLICSNAEVLGLLVLWASLASEILSHR